MDIGEQEARRADNQIWNAGVRAAMENGGVINDHHGIGLKLSRLMKDGIGEGYTRADHAAVANQLFASYSRVQEARSLASVIGEEELSPADKRLLAFGRAFDQKFLAQPGGEARTIDQSLELAWRLLSTLPKEELDRIDEKWIEQYYRPSEL